ncbi:MAG: quinol:electron acceptor oxidoreductase subunit ActD [Anaerolineales bacterium]
MPDQVLLGLFHEATPTANTIDQLLEVGIPDNRITVMSGVPYQQAMLGRKRVYRQLIPTALAGAVVGLLTGLFLTVGTPLLYPILVGGQPIIPIPPSLIILFEFTMLGTMLATFGGLLAESRFPRFGTEVYDHRVTEGHLGILVQSPEEQADEVQRILEANGAHHLQRQDAPLVERHAWRRWGLVVGLILLPTVLLLLFAYAVISVPLPDQMVHQPSIAYEQGPRLAAPTGSIPIQGPVLIDGWPASQPVPPSDESLQRGSVLYGIDCELCHGPEGKGNGRLAVHFVPHPADLTREQIQSLPDDILFLVITEGRGLMPSLAENLGPSERWDVINYMHSLAEPSDAAGQ